MKKYRTADLTTAAMMVAIIAIFAQITIPVGLVPVTLQTAGVILAVTILDHRRTFFALTAYVGLGLVGLPVFSMGKAGLGVIIGPTGGFLFGFIIGGFLGAWYLSRHKRPRLLQAYVASSIALAVNLIVGGFYFALIMARPLLESFAITVFPFLLIEAGKIAAFTPLGFAVRKALP
ncbi:MAG: biotin transporter BioY [Clostridiales bacterium]|jgi:biotin transport system substrate-specific component|nr:biotin transporter BioY [Clostridiales bacterium]